MRKYAVILFILIGGMIASAANPLRLKSGTLSPLKGKGGTVHVTLDFSKTRANRKPLEQYLIEDIGSDMETFHKYEPEMMEWFREKWNDEIEEGPQAISSGESALRLHVRVRTLQMGAKAGGGGSTISGYADFYREGETEPFAVVEILKFNGTMFGGTLHSYVGLKQCFNDLAEYLCDLIYHSK